MSYQMSRAVSALTWVPLILAIAAYGKAWRFQTGNQQYWIVWTTNGSAGAVNLRLSAADGQRVRLPLKAGSWAPGTWRVSRKWLGVSASHGAAFVELVPKEGVGSAVRSPVPFRSAGVPYAMVFALAAVPPAWRFGPMAINGYRRRQRIRTGRCYSCGYDIRASAGRCPECGVDILTRSEHVAETDVGKVTST